MDEQERQRRRVAIAEYIGELVRRSVFSRSLLDTSKFNTGEARIRDHLTPGEVAERELWAENRSELLKHYTIDIVLKNLISNEMLLLRVAPPLLVFEYKSASRSAPKDPRRRLYLNEIGFWRDFEDNVRLFDEPPSENIDRVVDVLFLSLEESSACFDESDEGGFLKTQVLEKLQNAGWLKRGSWSVAMGKLTAEAKHVRTHFRLLGTADHFLVAGQSKTVPIEFKSTHNLLLPNDGAKAARRYNRAIRKMKDPNGSVRTIYWDNIAHPVAQTMYYMFVCRSRYGILSSGTRTYFFKVEDTDDGPRVTITNAWFVEQEDYLRALAYLYHLAKENGNFIPPDDWHTDLRTTPVNRSNQGQPAVADDSDDDDAADDNPNRDEPGPQDDNDGGGPNGDQPGGQDDTDGQGRADESAEEPPRKSQKSNDQGSGAGGSTTMQLMTWLDPGAAPSIPRVDGKDVKFLETLGFGNNILCLAQWNDTEVALKVFDACKHLEWFENEIRAYEHLKDAWGVLVPEPYFIADWNGFVVLGLPLGRIPNSSDIEIVSERRRLFHTLRRDYGFEHLDQNPRNVIYLPDKSGKGKDHLVAIDLEAYEIFR